MSGLNPSTSSGITMSGGGMGTMPTVQNFPSFDTGGVTKSDMFAQLHKNEAVVPLDRLPEILKNMSSRLPTGLGKAINIYMSDTIDLRGSVGSMNNSNDVDKMYRDVILPAKRRNIERFRNTIAEVIE